VNKQVEENESLLKESEALAIKDQQREVILKQLRAILSEARKRRDAAESEVQKLKRKRAGSASPPPSHIKLLVRPQSVTTQQQAPPSPARTEPPPSAQPSNKRSRNRKDRWVVSSPTSANVDGFNKSLDPVLNSPLTSFQSKADITSEINASSDHLRLGRANKLVFHRSTVEYQVKVIRKALALHTLALYCYSSTAVHLAVQLFCCLG
jgi:hypothetical protein